MPKRAATAAVGGVDPEARVHDGRSGAACARRNARRRSGAHWVERGYANIGNVLYAHVLRGLPYLRRRDSAKLAERSSTIVYVRVPSCSSNGKCSPDAAAVDLCRHG